MDRVAGNRITGVELCTNPDGERKERVHADHVGARPVYRPAVLPSVPRPGNAEYTVGGASVRERPKRALHSPLPTLHNELYIPSH